MTASPLERLERVLAMVPWLLEHPGVTLHELAERFGATPEEVAADLDTLGYCGLPGYGGGDLVEVRIVGDAVTVQMADFFARPLTLSLREAMPLLLAGRAIAAVDALPESAALGRALDKLSAAFAAMPTDAAQLAAAQVAVDLTGPGVEHVPALRRAVAERRVVHVVYRSASKQQRSERDVEPWAVASAQGAWYLQGHCRAVDDTRTFRLDRIERLELTDAPAGPPPAAPPAAPVYVPGPGDPLVELELDPSAWWLPETLVVEDVERRRDHRVVRFRSPHEPWCTALVLSLAGAARVRAPATLRRRVGEAASAALARYADAPIR